MNALYSVSALFFLCLGSAMAGEPWPIDPLWKSAEFRRAFAGAYGTDGRIEPGIDSGERAVLDSVAEKMRSGDRDAAISVLTASARTPDSAALLFSLGSLRFEAGKAEEASADFKKALAKYPIFRDAHRNLAVALIQLNQFEDAEPHLRRAMELGSQDGLMLGLLGYTHERAGRNQAALQAYRLAQLSMPSETQWKLGEANALLALGEPRAAASVYADLLTANPDDAQLWVSQANALLQIGEPLSAVANLEMARRMGKLDPAETITLGHLYLNESLVADAVACYREAIEAEAPAGFARAIEAVESLTRYREWAAADALAKIVAHSPAYAESLRPAAPTSPDAARFERARAMIELESGDAEAGAARIEALIQRDPLDAEALILLARFRAAEDRIPEAEMLLEQAARDSEHEAVAMRVLGEVRIKSGDFAKAVQALKRSLELAPDPRLAEYVEAVERLTPPHNLESSP